MNVCLVFISFFGNIMFANILIAFLSNEYDIISKNADYDTKANKYLIIQSYKITENDFLVFTPFFLSPALIFAFPISLKKSFTPKIN
jgi:hypothetical protein